MFVLYFLFQFVLICLTCNQIMASH